jgi:hypothetical protein
LGVSLRALVFDALSLAVLIGQHQSGLIAHQAQPARVGSPNYGLGNRCSRLDGDEFSSV